MALYLLHHLIWYTKEAATSTKLAVAQHQF